MSLPSLLRSLVPPRRQRPPTSPAAASARAFICASAAFGGAEQVLAAPFQEAELAGLPAGAAREEVRSRVARAVGAEADDAVLFVDAEPSSALVALIDIMGLSLASERSPRAPARRPVVFVSAHEQHDNLRAWQRSAARLEIIPLRADGALDLTVLKAKLITHSRRGVSTLGSFSATSSVTGARRDADAISGLLHAYGACALWDYTAARDDAGIEMHPERLPWHMGCPHKDAVLLGPRVFPGAAWSRGVLVLNRALAKREVVRLSGGADVEPVETRAV